MTEQATEEAAQTVPDTGDSSAAESPTNLLDTVTSEEAAPQDGQNTSTQDGESTEQQEASGPYTFTAPEGSNVDADSLPVQALGEQAAKLGISNEHAQQILEGVGPALTQHYQQMHKQMMDQWAEETKRDPEIGGTKLNQSLTEAKQAFATFDPDGQALEVLTEWGLVNHPAILKFAQRVRTSIGDGKFVTGASRETQPQHSARQHFPGSDLND